MKSSTGEEEQEILAREKGITVNNLRVKVHRARTQLQNELKHREE